MVSRLFRSEEMALVQLYMQRETAHTTLDELGRLGCLQFRDLNAGTSAFQRSFVNEVKRCDELERKLRVFDTQIKKSNVIVEFAQKPEHTNLAELEAQFDAIETELLQMNVHEQRLLRNRNELGEMEGVLDISPSFFTSETQGEAEATTRSTPAPGFAVGDGGDGGQQSSFADRSRDMEAGSRVAYEDSLRLGYVTGVIPRDKIESFHRVLFRATRGNTYFRHSPREDDGRGQVDPVTGEHVAKDVFIVFFSGERSQTKVAKICESFGANMYPFPEDQKDQVKLAAEVESRMNDLDVVIADTEEHRLAMLRDISQYMSSWCDKVAKEKAVYHALNLCSLNESNQVFIAEAWVPSRRIEDAQLALRHANLESGAHFHAFLEVMPTDDAPPTYFETNKFTRTFQGIVDSYGMARYKEINPGLMTIFTFPFLFAIMFGDLGHGSMMFLIALMLVVYEKMLAKRDYGELFKMLFDGRYMLLMMGGLSIYTGLMYNDCFGLSFPWFNSEFHYPANESQAVVTDPAYTYPFGVDPAWRHTANEIPYYNSLKMKVSIIFGVTQMTIGVLFNLFNALYFRKWIDVLFGSLPELIFINSIFGYLVFAILFKWGQDWSVNNPPSLTNMLIGMFLNPGVIPEGEVLYAGQASVQNLLTVASLIAVPWLLLPKPLIMYFQNKRKTHGYRYISDPEDDDASAPPASSEGAPAKAATKEDDFNMSDVFVHQVIHTIEFCLGCVSNTASYLRLWALSLAHAELSAVFWELLFAMTINTGNPIIIMIGFIFWALATIAVLLGMEALSAFLHTLRLHWVEFQNKFYKADGYKFEPFDFAAVVLVDGSSPEK